MGILNVTPDSFSDGGLFFDPGRAIDKALEMDAEGADIIDVGGESTRPGSESVPAQEEKRRVLSVIEGLTGRVKAAISIDTWKVEVATAALEAGASIVNDVTALRGEVHMARTIADREAGCVLMHMQGKPKSMQKNPHYDDLFGEITAFLRESVQAATDAGVPREAIVVDPGIGFGKTLEHNLRIIGGIDRFRELGCPVMLGPSRKSMIGSILGTEVTDRLEGTAAAVAAGALLGADIVRVHDVREMSRVVRVADAIREASDEQESGT